MISRNDVTGLCNGAIRVDPEEIYFYEPDVLQLDSSEILNAIQNAAKINQVELMEHCQVYDFERDSHGYIFTLHTNQGKISCENVINASGGWSCDLFARIDIHIPIALEPVYAANFLVSSQDVAASLPILITVFIFDAGAAVFYTYINPESVPVMPLPALLAEP